MFDILFGWRKASKCKKLLKTLQCRLKLLKSKRAYIVKQSTENVSDLIRDGYYHSAFGRVEQIIMDQNMVEAYHLLEQYCEFVIISLPYIRKHWDLPNDINEAAATLIFSSSRFGDLPELQSVRKFFEERYGQRFVTTAVELLPGNLVSHQIKETVNIKTVPDDVKYRLLEEIATNCFRAGPLLLEHEPELQLDQEIEIHNGGETQGRNHEYVDDFSISEDNKISELETDKFTVDHSNGMGILDSSSSETSSKVLPEEMIYLDDIEEFVSPMSKNGGNFQDQRLFMFKSFINHDQELAEKPVSKKRKASRKRSKRRSVTVAADSDSAAYYGESNESSDPGDPVIKLEDTQKLKIQARELRAVTMPVERQSFTDNILRSNSVPFEHSESSSCRHIHPKLPDYDELEAKFMALKREALQNQNKLQSS